MLAVLEGREVRVIDHHDPAEVARWVEQLLVPRVIKERAWGSLAKGEEVSVSTVFLGMNVASIGGREPLWFETMVFGGGHDGWQQRHRNYEEAEKGHDSAVSMVEYALYALKEVSST